MKTIYINTQEELDGIKKVKIDEEVIVQKRLKLNCILEVYGKLRAEFGLETSWNSHAELWGSSHAVLRGSSHAVLRGSSHAELWDSSHAELWGSSHAVLRGSSHAVLQDSSHAELWGSSHAELWDSSHAVLRGSSHAELWDSSHAVLRDSSHAELRGSSHAELWGSSSINIFSASLNVPIKLFGFSVAIIPFDLKIKITKAKTAIVQTVKPLDFFDRHGIKKNKTIILYKRVSHDYKTQEGTSNETRWNTGATVEHPDWNPSHSECGEGKFHACPKPYFADEFRDIPNDKYIAIRVAAEDVFEWKDNPLYPHKIGFRKGKVLYECDRYGKKT